MSYQKRLVALVALATTAGLVLTGCAAGGAAPAPAQAEAPASADYVLAVAQDFQGVDRASYSSEAAKSLADIMQSRLLNLSKANDSATACMDQAPAQLDESSPLVETWNVTEDGLGLEVKLRDGVQSAAGNTLTAADVQWTIERILAMDTTGKSLWFTIGGFDEANPITIVDDLNFTLNLPTPNALAPYALAGTAGLIYDSETVKANVTAEDPWGAIYLKDHTANYGPWDLTTFSTQQLVFEPNANYTSERGNISKLTVQSVPDASSRIQLVQSGEASETNGLDYAQLAALQSAEGVTLTTCDSTARDWLGLNASDPIVGNVDVRRAVSLALDRDAIASSVYNGFATAATSGLSQAFGTEEGDYYQRNLDEAKSLLATAGYPDGFDLELSVSPAQPGAYSATLATLIQQQLGEIGINVTITTVPSAVDYRNAGIAKSMQAWLLAESPAFANAGYSAWLTNGDGGLQNYAGFSSPELDAAADESMAATETSDELMQELASIIDQEQSAIYLVDRATTFVRANCVQSVPTATMAVDYAEAVTTCV